LNSLIDENKRKAKKKKKKQKNQRVMEVFYGNGDLQKLIGKKFHQSCKVALLTYDNTETKKKTEIGETNFRLFSE
jgi:hypothetical protein